MKNSDIQFFIPLFEYVSLRTVHIKIVKDSDGFRKTNQRN
jgi:hypothetical protein